MSITRSITRPIVRGIARGIVRSGLDPDAAAYIAAVEAALSSSISGDQKNAINTFFKTGKSDGWYSSIKRLYLPIWADPAANAIDMITRTSGTFPVPAGVDNSNVGYVKGNGITGRFISDASGHGVGMTSSGGGLIVLVKVAPSGAGFSAVGGHAGVTDAIQMFHEGGSIKATVAGSSPIISHSETRANITGIYISSRVSTTSLALYRRKTAGFSTLGTSSTNVAGNTVSNSAMTFMAQGTFIYSDAEFGVFGMHTGLSLSNATTFSANLKTLWETCTRLTLP